MQPTSASDQLEFRLWSEYEKSCGDPHYRGKLKSMHAACACRSVRGSAGVLTVALPLEYDARTATNSPAESDVVVSVLI